MLWPTAAGTRWSTGESELERVIAAVVPAVVDEVLDTIDLNAIVRRAGRHRRTRRHRRHRRDHQPGRHRRDRGAGSTSTRSPPRIDLDAIVDRLDIDAIVASVDLEAIVDRLNVVGIAEDVINEIDLPEIIRDSTGSMASQVVRDARVQTIDADEAISRLVDRVLRRKRARATDAPGRPESLSPGADGLDDGAGT